MVEQGFDINADIESGTRPRSIGEERGPTSRARPPGKKLPWEALKFSCDHKDLEMAGSIVIAVPIPADRSNRSDLPPNLTPHSFARRRWCWRWSRVVLVHEPTG